MAGDLRPVVFALDAGATTTRAIVVDAAGELVWRRESAGASLTRRGIAGALEQVRALRDEAEREVEAFYPRLRAVAAGFAGGRSIAVQMEMGRALADFCTGEDPAVPVPVTVTHDAHIALVGAHGPDGEGCVLVSGTGSICMARTERGDTALAGGWGWPLGDEGSAVWLGWMAVRRALAAWEEDRSCSLTALILEAWEVTPGEAGDPHILMRRAAEAARDPDRYARLAPGVFACALDGDPDAMELVRAAGLALGELVEKACAQLGLSPDREIPLALMGSLGASRRTMLREAVRDGAGRWGAGLDFRTPRLPAEGGAAILALTVAGFAPGAGELARLAHALQPAETAL